MDFRMLFAPMGRRGRNRPSEVLTTMLLLRKIHTKYHGDAHLHVVGENSLESTAVLALAPRCPGLFDCFLLPDEHENAC